MQNRFNVYLNNKLIDGVYYNKGISKEEVKESLINHDGYDSNIKVVTARKSSIYKELKKDLLKYLPKEDIQKCINNLKSQVAYRELEILKNYDSIELSGTNIVNIYAKNENGFGIDIRKETLGNICN